MFITCEFVYVVYMIISLENLPSISYYYPASGSLLASWHHTGAGRIWYA